MRKDKKNKESFVYSGKDKLNNIDFVKINDDVYKAIDGALNLAKSGLDKYDDFISNISKTKSENLEPVKNSQVVVQVPKQSAKASIFKALGITGLGVNAVSAIGILTAMVLGGAETAPIMGLSLITWVVPWSVLSGYLLKKGTDIQQKNSRFRRYLNSLSHSPIALVSDLANSVNRDDKFTKNELKQLMAEEYFLQARLVEDEEIFILDNKSFDQYKNYLDTNPKVVHNYREEKEEIENNEKQTIQEAFMKSTQYLYEISAANEKIKDANVNGSTTDIIRTSQLILTKAKKNPREMPGLRKFTDYYLPTIKKLVINYQEFEEKNLQGYEVLDTMDEIEKSIHVIDDALKKLLSNMFAETAVDVKTDLKVLKSIMNQDGLIDSDFEIKKENIDNG